MGPIYIVRQFFIFTRISVLIPEGYGGAGFGGDVVSILFKIASRSSSQGMMVPVGNMQQIMHISIHGENLVFIELSNRGAAFDSEKLDLNQINRFVQILVGNS